ncbi:unnamed protein product [marine sediment metagenome]|uniref:Orotidine 5'-phosphate decarboxylase n=1 Tax=marine sediment metagenome TaxID=412755 RepID=X0V8X4_9ZZZZ
MGVYIFNVHTSGGYEMMKAAAEATKKTSLTLGINKPLILGVTLLTSINQEILEKEIGIKKGLEEQVVHLAKLAKTAGLDGVVASSWEIKKIRKTCGEDFVILTPGIRPAGKSSDDQKRVMTPQEAIKLGADFLVIGRPIRNAANPVQAAKEILSEMEGN